MSVTAEWIRQLPKVELHVHIEGSIRPETVLRLAKKHGVSLPANDIAGLRHWYEFRDFAHFVSVYLKVTDCVRTVEDLEFVLQEFIRGQGEQNIRYTEATYTASTIEARCGISFSDQLGALQRARAWGQAEFGVDIQFVLDIVRGESVERATQVLKWVADSLGQGVCALGLAGFEDRGTVMYRDVFVEAQRLGVPTTIHAGETEGAWSVRESLDITGTRRIGHGVRSIEDPELMARLRDGGIVLEVCPTSNVCLGGYSSLSEHPLPQLMAAGIKVTLNSDDPPMFSTTLTDEFIRCAEAFDWDQATILRLINTAIDAAFLSEDAKNEIRLTSRSG